MRTMVRTVGVAALAMASVGALAAEKPFDPTRDAAKDFRAAMAQAKSEHKNILMDVGGNWCPWCLVLDRTLAEDAGLHALLEKNYVVLHVNFSKENQNAGFPEAVSGSEGISGLVCAVG